MIWRAPASLAPSTDAQADAAEAHHRDRLARLEFRGVDDRADPGQHRAAEQSREFERQVGVDLHAGFARHDRVGRERGDAEQVVDRLGLEGKPPLAGEQRPGGVGLGRRLAERGTSRSAWPAAAAARRRTPAPRDRRLRGRSPRRRPPRRFPPPRGRAPSASGRGREPSITDRSEWQRPAAAILTRTSPRPGGARSSSMISSGFDCA